MTTTEDTTTTTTAPAAELGAGVQFAITLPFAAFQTALSNVYTAGAGTDDTLPVLTGVLVELADNGDLTFAATDRYVLAWQEVKVDAEPGTVTGAGVAFLDKSTVKDMLAVKLPKYGDTLPVTLSLAAKTDRDTYGALTVMLPDSRVITYPAWQGTEFVNWRRLADNFRPADDSESLAVVKYNPAFLARFAKIMGRRAIEGITITQVMNQKGSQCSTCEGTGKGTYNESCSRCQGTGKIKPTASRITAGDLTAVIMHIRLT